MRGHRHIPVLAWTTIEGFSKPLAFPGEPRAHGGYTLVRTCTCGAKQKVNRNGIHQEIGPWEENES